MFTVGPAHRCDNHTEFDCRTNYRCVPLWLVCNGHNDCRDNSDEQGCGESATNRIEVLYIMAVIRNCLLKLS